MKRHSLQRILRPARVETTPLYWRATGGAAGDRLAQHDVLDLDTYFNSFDEASWSRHARFSELAVEVTVSGQARVELWRHTRASGSLLLARGTACEAAPLVLRVPPPPHPRAAGRLCLLLTAEEDGTSLRSGRWTARGEARDVVLMPVICTFNRDRALGALLERVVADEAACAALAGIVVINHGQAGLAERLGPAAARLGRRLHIVQQDNLGGAGGFTRGLMVARDLGATHAVLMDDDVDIEPEALARTRCFYALGTRDVLLAGHMLDLFRPNHLYEGGARLDDARLALEPLHQGADLGAPGALGRFLEPTPMHYNGWWYLGLPLDLLDRHGWPMPCFIRGDDVEFGRRLHDAGVTQVAMAGIGIWHEPFYAKLGGWHLYYEFRNMLVLAASRLRISPQAASRIALKWILADLLTFRYQRAALLLRAVEDFLGGPSIFEADPRAIHASLDHLRKRYGCETLSREQVAEHHQPARGPRSRLAFLAELAGALVGEWMRPTGTGGVFRIAPPDHLWFRVRGAQAVAVDEGWEIDQPLYRRSRESFRTLFKAFLRLGVRMHREMPEAFASWREAHPEFTGEAAWRRYFAEHGGASKVPAREAPALLATGMAD